jgi:tight adherence protein B
MSLGLTGPLVILLMILLAGPVILVADSRQRKLQQQVALVAALTERDTLSERTRSIRRVQVRFPKLKDLGRSLLRYEPNLPEAYPLPWPLVVIAALLAALASGLLASISLSPVAYFLIGGGVGVFAIRGLFGWQRDRYGNTLIKQLPDALQFVVSAVRAGFPVLEAFRSLTREAPEPTRGQFVQVINEVALGRSVPDALLNMYYRTGVTEHAIFAVTLAVQTKSGGHLAETIATLADTVRERSTIAARAKALSGEATVSATVLSILPVVTGVALSLIRPGYLDPLFHDPRGKRLFLMGVGALLSGIWTMRRMIAGTVKQ